jgi:uncharacterized protein (DUF983 family)
MPPAHPDQPLIDESSESSRPMAWPGLRRTATIVARAALLRCPNCGRGPVLRHYLAMRARCGHCGLALERGERDYFIGSMMFNLVVAELLFAAAFVATLLATWPNVPWDALEWSAPAAMFAAPFILFPFSKLTWLGFDILLRPVTPDELAPRGAGSS